MLELKLRENSTHLEVTLHGALTLREVKDAYDYFSPLWQRQKIFIVNLASVTDLDTIGFQVLLYWKIQAKTDGRKLHYVNHSTPVLAAMDLFGSVATFGDKIRLSEADKERFKFSYGARRTPPPAVH